MMIDRGGVNRFDGINLLIDGWFSLRGTSVHVVQSCWLEAEANFFIDAWTTHGRGGATNGERAREDGTQRRWRTFFESYNLKLLRCKIRQDLIAILADEMFQK